MADPRYPRFPSFVARRREAAAVALVIEPHDHDVVNRVSIEALKRTVAGVLARVGAPAPPCPRAPWHGSRLDAAADEKKERARCLMTTAAAASLRET